MIRLPLLARRPGRAPGPAASEPPPAPRGGLCPAPDVLVVAAALGAAADRARLGPWAAVGGPPELDGAARVAAAAALRARTESERRPAPPSARTPPFARFACRARDLGPVRPAARPTPAAAAAVLAALAPSPQAEEPGFGRWAAPWAGR